MLGNGEEHCWHIWDVKAVKTNTMLSDFDVNGSIPVYGDLCFVVGELDIWTFLDVKHMDVVEV